MYCSTNFCVTEMFGKFPGVDEAAETVLDLFRERRDEIARDIDYPELDLEGTNALSHISSCTIWNTVLISPLMFAAYTAICSSGSSLKAVSAEDILIAEGTATLELADQQVCSSNYWLFRYQLLIASWS
jgi:hypothetical protein